VGKKGRGKGPGKKPERCESELPPAAKTSIRALSCNLYLLIREGVLLWVGGGTGRGKDQKRRRILA